MGTISIQHIILIGNGDAVADLTGVSGSNILLDKQAGNLALTVTDAINLQGTVEGVLKLIGAGTITLSDMVVCQKLDRDEFTGTIITGIYWIDYSGTVVWLFATHANLFDPIYILGGIR